MSCVSRSLHAPLKGVVVVTKKGGKYNNSRVMVSFFFDFYLSLSEQLSVGVLGLDQITPGTKILQIS